MAGIGRGCEERGEREERREGEEGGERRDEK